MTDDLRLNKEYWKKQAAHLSWIAVLLLVALSACEKQDLTFKGPSYVTFTDTSASFLESYSKPIKIAVHIVGTPLADPTTVNYTVSGTAREGIDYNIIGEKGILTIPAKQYFGYITVQLLNNANNILESQNLTFTLTGTTGNLEVAAGKNHLQGKSTSLTIVDDCILGGTYLGTIKGQAPISDVSVTSTDCINYTLSNWNVGLLNYPTVTLSLTFKDNGDNTLEIPEQNQGKLAGYLGVEKYTIAGNGSVNPATKVITLNIQLVDEENSPTVQVTFIPD
jgi:hypothetical protein